MELLLKACSGRNAPPAFVTTAWEAIIGRLAADERNSSSNFRASQECEGDHDGGREERRGRRRRPNGKKKEAGHPTRPEKREG